MLFLWLLRSILSLAPSPAEHASQRWQWKCSSMGWVSVEMPGSIAFYIFMVTVCAAFKHQQPQSCSYAARKKKNNIKLRTPVRKQGIRKTYKITRLQNRELGQKAYLQRVSHSKSMQTSSELSPQCSYTGNNASYWSVHFQAPKRAAS